VTEPRPPVGLGASLRPLRAARVAQAERTVRHTGFSYVCTRRPAQGTRRASVRSCGGAHLGGGGGLDRPPTLHVTAAAVTAVPLLHAAALRVPVGLPKPILLLLACAPLAARDDGLVTPACRAASSIPVPTRMNREHALSPALCLSVLAHPAMGDSRTRLLAVTAAVGLTPVALYYGHRLYRKYRYRRRSPSFRRHRWPWPAQRVRRRGRRRRRTI